MKVMVMMGSKNDHPKVALVINSLLALHIKVVPRVLSAHRSPEFTAQVARGLRDNGFEVVVCCAGKAAHLAGVVASYTTIPVIGLPLSNPDSPPMTSLLSTIEMPPGVPVLTVGVDAFENAAQSCVRILSIKYPSLIDSLVTHSFTMQENVKAADIDMIERYKERCFIPNP